MKTQSFIKTITITIMAVFILAVASPASDTYWRTLRKDVFVVNYLPYTPFEDVDLVIKRFEAARKTLQKYFDKKFKFRVEVVIYPSAEDFTVSTGHPWWHGAAWLDGKVHLQPPQVLR